MARTTKKGPRFHLMPLVNLIGFKEVIGQLTANPEDQKKMLATLLADRRSQEELVKNLASDPDVQESLMETVLANMSPDRREKFLKKFKKS